MSDFDRTCYAVYQSSLLETLNAVREKSGLEKSAFTKLALTAGVKSLRQAAGLQNTPGAFKNLIEAGSGASKAVPGQNVPIQNVQLADLIKQMIPGRQAIPLYPHSKQLPDSILSKLRGGGGGGPGGGGTPPVPNSWRENVMLPAVAGPRGGKQLPALIDDASDLKYSVNMGGGAGGSIANKSKELLNSPWGKGLGLGALGLGGGWAGGHYLTGRPSGANEAVNTMEQNMANMGFMERLGMILKMLMGNSQGIKDRLSQPLPG